METGRGKERETGWLDEGQNNTIFRRKKKYAQHWHEESETIFQRKLTGLRGAGHEKNWIKHKNIINRRHIRVCVKCDHHSSPDNQRRTAGKCDKKCIYIKKRKWDRSGAGQWRVELSCNTKRKPYLLTDDNETEEIHSSCCREFSLDFSSCGSHYYIT